MPDQVVPQIFSSERPRGNAGTGTFQRPRIEPDATACPAWRPAVIIKTTGREAHPDVSVLNEYAGAAHHVSPNVKAPPLALRAERSASRP
ncbi:hypothetical protein KCP76_20805 [Salmonella enterica subsp. enterica serovar Weltevreden]|nr:hypothetical protein KCP76_20805 [Salmonella enterica subsp. enterica serovar Weltevreden]